jgi:hypothetical protein
MIRKITFLMCFLAALSTYSQLKVGQVEPHAPNRLADLKVVHGKSFRRAGMLGLDQSSIKGLKAKLQTNDTLTLQLFSDYSIIAVKENNIKRTTNGFYWRGNLIKGGDGYIDLYLRNGMLSGTVYTSHEVYKLDAMGPNTIRVVELNPEEDSKFECHIANEEENHIETTKPVLMTTTPPAPEAPPATNVTVDVMVIYPQAIEDLMGGPAGMENEVNYRIEEANQVFTNSLINVELRLVHHQVETSVSANAQGAGDVRTSQVEVLRAVHKADLVSFWSVNGSAGSGFNFEGTGSASTGFNTSKFSLVQTYYTFIHEIGHNMGAKHDRQTYYEKSPTSSKLNVTPYYRYGKSFVGYRSIMSYNSCDDLAGGSSDDCERVPYMTNPDVMVNGAPFGVPGDFQTYDVNGPANNSRRINESAVFVADYYDGDPVVTYELVVTNGTGSGSYSEGGTVIITADNANQGKVFDQWVGDVVYLNNTTTSIATVTIPNLNINITATYRTIDYTQNVTLTIPVIGGDDDVEESGDGTGNMYLTSSDLELTEDGSKGNQTIGIRFRNLNIPTGMEIQSASITFTADASGSASTSLSISADENVVSNTFGTTAFDVSKRIATTNTVSWSPLAWTKEGTYNSPDLSMILQELIEGSQWSTGNSMSFIITGRGGRSAYAYDGDPTKVPVLNVVFKIRNETPIVKNEIPDQLKCQDFGTYTIDLKDVFEDVETSDASLVYAVSGNTNVDVVISNGIATISSVSEWFGKNTLVFEVEDEGGKTTTDMVNFEVRKSYTITELSTICFGDSYSFGTQNLTSGGSFTEIFSAANGCDSTVTLNLTVRPENKVSVSESICFGGSYEFGNQTLTSEGDYTAVFTSSEGCDSTVILTLKIVNELTNSKFTTICFGDSYDFGTQTLITGGDYIETFTSVGGCDSLVILNLTVLPLYNE